ncbi:uncharacterized protein MELLADRAFT_71828, partial [Melampsora larici-populina 98AG31]
MYEANYQVWNKARKARDSKSFKKATIKAKGFYRQLLKMIGHQCLMDNTNQWNPAMWDWSTFEKRVPGKRFNQSVPYCQSISQFIKHIKLHQYIIKIHLHDNIIKIHYLKIQLTQIHDIKPNSSYT